MTLGANIGTCITSLLAAFVADGTDALQVALAHLFFNITGILIWYPLPFMRRIPLNMARQLGKATRLWKGFQIVYILITFVAIPLLLMGLSSLFGQGKSGIIAGSIIVVVLVLSIAVLIYWLNFRNGRRVVATFLRKRQHHSDTLETLPYDIIYIERKIKELQDHTMCEPAAVAASSSSSSSHSKDVSDERHPRRRGGALFTNVSDHIDYALRMVEALIEHTGLNPNQDLDVDNENLGRMLHKEKEAVPEVDTSGWMATQFLALGFVLIIIGLVIWGIVYLFGFDSTGYNSMGGLISVMLCLFVFMRLYSFFFDDGKAKSLKDYKDNQLKKMCYEKYPETISRINVDLNKIASHTHMPALEEDNLPKTAQDKTIIENDDIGEKGTDLNSDLSIQIDNSEVADDA